MSNKQNANPADKGEKLFTQEEVDAIVRERLERERKRFNADADTVAEVHKELLTLKSELEQVKADRAEKETAYKAEKIKNGIVNELNKVHAVDPGTLKDLFTQYADIDDTGALVIKGEDGTNKPLSDHIADWAQHNIWAVKSIQQPGSGDGVSPHQYSKDMGLRQAFGLKREE